MLLLLLILVAQSHGFYQLMPVSDGQGYFHISVNDTITTFSPVANCQGNPGGSCYNVIMPANGILAIISNQSSTELRYSANPPYMQCSSTAPATCTFELTISTFQNSLISLILLPPQSPQTISPASTTNSEPTFLQKYWMYLIAVPAVAIVALKIRQWHKKRKYSEGFY